MKRAKRVPRDTGTSSVHLTRQQQPTSWSYPGEGVPLVPHLPLGPDRQCDESWPLGHPQLGTRTPSLWNPAGQLVAELDVEPYTASCSACQAAASCFCGSGAAFPKF